MTNGRFGAALGSLICIISLMALFQIRLSCTAFSDFYLKIQPRQCLRMWCILLTINHSAVSLRQDVYVWNERAMDIVCEPIGAVTLQRMIERMSSVWKFEQKLLIRTTFDCLNSSYRRRSLIVAFITVCVAYTSVIVTYAYNICERTSNVCERTSNVCIMYASVLVTYA